MGVQVLLSIIMECREVLTQRQNHEKYASLINKIDEQLLAYKDFSQKYQDNVNTSLSMKQIGQKRILSSGKKKEDQNLQKSFFSSVSEFLGSKKEQADFSQFDLSQVSSISLGNIHLGQTSIPIKFYAPLNENENLQVNNSFQSLNTISKKSASIRQIQKSFPLQIQDFFVIDFNFLSNQYEIIPKMENFNGRCLLIDEEQQFFDPTAYQTPNQPQTTNKLKYSEVRNKNGTAIFPFEHIIQRSGNESNLSGEKVTDNARYSTQVQISSSSKVNISEDGSKQTKRVKQLYEMRQVIVNLLICNSSSHIKQIKPSSSMTDLLRLTTNPSSKNKKLEHIVIPSFIQIRDQKTKDVQKCNRYTHIIKTYEGVSHGMRYFQCERFYVVVQREKRFIEVQCLVKGLISNLLIICLEKCFQTRIHNDKQVDNVKYANIRKYIEQVSLIPRQKLHLFSQKTQSNQSNCDSPSFLATNSLQQIQEVCIYCSSAMKFKFTLEIPPNSEAKSFNLLLILVYFVIFQYKIVFLTTKGYENIISEVMNALVHMIGQLRYVYPIILAVLTNHHIEFSNSPVPGLIGFWGSQSRYKKSVDYMKNKLKQEAAQNLAFSSKSSKAMNTNSLSTIVVDMNKHEFISHTFTHEQLYIIENLHCFVKKRNKKQNLIQTINHLFNKRLLSQEKQSQTQNNWIAILKKRLKISQMYEEFMKYQQSLKK